jgi:hypothetical protein
MKTAAYGVMLNQVWRPSLELRSESALVASLVATWPYVILLRGLLCDGPAATPMTFLPLLFVPALLAAVAAVVPSPAVRVALLTAACIAWFSPLVLIVTLFLLAAMTESFLVIIILALFVLPGPVALAVAVVADGRRMHGLTGRTVAVATGISAGAIIWLSWLPFLRGIDSPSFAEFAITAAMAAAAVCLCFAMAVIPCPRSDDESLV